MLKSRHFCNFLFILLIFAACFHASAQSFIVSFPTGNGVNPNPQPLTIAGDDSALQVQLDVNLASVNGASVTIQLPAGIQYVPGSLAKVSDIGGLTITENGGTASAPVFKVGPNNLAPGNRIIFNIRRTAGCTAQNIINASQTFADTVSGTIGTTTTSATSPVYAVYRPVFTIVQPAAQTDAVVGGMYTRTFSIKNGGIGCAKNVYLSIDYPNNAIQQNSLSITKIGGNTVNIPLTPSSTSGTTKNYTIPLSSLPNNALCNNQEIIFTENYKVLACNGTTVYGASWGTSSTALCQTVTGTGSITMATGTPAFSVVSGARINFVNSCTPFTTRYVVKNSATGNKNGAGMYNLIIRWGSNSGGAMTGSRRDFINFNTATIGSVSMPVNNGTANGYNSATVIANINLNNLPALNTDPDGPGGLEDLDGDGYFDDLAPGSSITIDIATSVNSIFSCNQQWSNVYDRFVDAQFTNMCSSALQTAPAQSVTGPGFNTQMQQLSDKSYAPANVFDGQVFRARLSVGYYSLSNPFDTNRTRYNYELILPPGLSLAPTPTAIWRPGQYPDNAATAGTAITPTQNGQVVTFQAPNEKMGYVEVNLVYSCGAGGSVSANYNLKRIDDNSAPTCNNNSSVFCGNLVIANAVCPGNCAAGPSITSLKVERADNSLGWTNSTMTTLQSRANISSYDLSKALLYDEINVTSAAIQRGAANNLFEKFSIKKLFYSGSSDADKISPIDVRVTIVRGTATVSDVTIPASAATLSNTSTGGSNPLQILDWNLSSALPAGGLLNGDKITTVARYSVIDNNFPRHDVQTGDSFYMYNKNAAGSEVYCLTLVPEMYLVSPFFLSGNNNPDFTGCNEASLGSSTHHYAYRFDSAGTKFQNEFRPAFLPKKLTFAVPPNYTLTGVRWKGASAPFAQEYLTYTATGNQYTVNFPERPFEITVTNDYAFTVDVMLTPTCGSAGTSPIYYGTLEYIPFYYYNKKQSNPPTTTATNGGISVNYTTSTKPAITLNNLTGTVQAAKNVETFRIRMASSGGNAAPYTWLAIPTAPGVTINKVYDETSGTAVELAPVQNSGYNGVWYQLDAAGMAVNTAKIFRIDFSYTTCNTTTFVVNAGWNCSSYPTSPSEYTCSKETLSLTFVPQSGSVQIQTIKEPGASVSLCTPIDYEFRVNSAGAGNIVANRFLINLPAGLNIVPGSMLVDYPTGSGNWQPVGTTTSGQTVTLDLTTHPAYPTDGLPGTLNDGGDPNKRLMDIKFQVTTSCSFVVGSNINVSAKANKTCGTPADGDGSVVASAPINITGANSTYRVSSTVTVPAGFNNCKEAITINLSETIITSTTTSGNGYLKVYVPQGYNYITGSFVCTSSICPTFAGVFTDAATNQKYVRLNVPAGLSTGTKMDLKLGFQPTLNIPSGAYSLDVIGIEDITGLTCSTAPGGTCSGISIQTGKTTYNYTLSCYCTKTAVTTTGGEPTTHGITALGRAGSDNGNWPMKIKAAYTVLDAKTKGFVINRVPTSALSSITAVKGMMVYDTTAMCLKIYNGTSWNCYNTQTCDQ